ncbi:dice1/dead/H box polypeptide, putative [Pediculus humanus corporis]|uniref:Dice1/dead/H box polypeptide, putative n=1 Tax=Pediculus humanus subsp. corporis TaxID=121224 RepID=E0W459_PEDHC|nr:dice1/dead/H box polypeptide, putative [Pediculus humanus corporis]EEB20415.1 dice1/dead/H box polypeptide, putative [Pediculus humanus corporis]
MTIIVFLIDTSASMNQRAYLGGRPTLLDVAKGAVETFVKVRQRSPESRVDRYMLLTFEDPPHNIKAGWKENLATFMNELKNLECTGLTTMGSALKHAFDVLNINRMQTGIDTYGQGRCPFFLEPSVIVVITDGGKLSNSSGVPEEFILPMNSPIPGSELTREPFRWDQRLFSLVLRLSGTPPVERDIGLVPSDISPIDAMCEVTGGRSYSITSHRMLMQCIDSLVQKVQSGVVINFEKIGPDPSPVDGKDENGEQSEAQDDKAEDTVKNNTVWQSCRKLIYVPRSAQKGFAVGYWPIPESFWPDLSASSLPPRTAHPNLKFTCTSQEPMVIENLPFDKYELEPSPLTQYILARKQPTVCWQVFVTNSYKNSEAGHPFGYLKASTNLTCVNLFVMPYNYPVLLQLLDELFRTHRLKPTNEWRIQLSNYLKMMPSYYVGPLRRALTKMGVPASLAQTLIPETTESSISYSVMQYLKKLKIQAKNDFERLCDEVNNKQNNKNIPEGIRVIPRMPLKKSLVSHPLLQDKFTSLKEQLNEFDRFVVGIPKIGEEKVGSGGFRNAFDIPRRNLLNHVLKMRKNFLHTSLSRIKLMDEDFRHSMPLSQMGNYQEHLKRLPPPLKEIETPPVRQHMFGNPFKIDKRMMVDEADVDVVGMLSRGTKRPLSDPGSPKPNNRRKPGPLPKDYTATRGSLISRSPSPAPISTITKPETFDKLTENDKPPEIVTDKNRGFAKVILGNAQKNPGMGVLKNSSFKNNVGGNNNVVVGNCKPETDGEETDMEVEVNGIRVFRLFLISFRINFRQPVLFIFSEVANSYNSRSRSPSPPVLTIENLQPYEPCNENMDTYQLLPPTITLQNDVEREREKRRRRRRRSGGGDGTAAAAADPQEIRAHNLKIKKLAFKYVRKPGKNYSALFSCLKNIKGGGKTKLNLIKIVVKECLRFKRKNLANLVELLITQNDH